MKEIKLYFIRHGETEWNLKELMQGFHNSPLTENGILGAKLTGKSLRHIPFVQAYSSTQQRAVETRDYIIQQLDAEPSRVALDGLKEMNFGLWEGVSIAELRQLPEFERYMHTPAQFDPTLNQGESFPQVLQRMRESLDHIVAAAPNGTSHILIVSHGTALRLLLCVLNGGDWQRHRDEAYFPKILNTSISLVNYHQANAQEQGTYSVSYYNRVNHL